MPTNLYLLTSEALPDLGEECEHLVVEEENEAATPGPDDESFGTTESCVTTLVTNCEDDDELRTAVAEWWLEMAGVKPTLELLATELSSMSDDQRDSISKLEPESWSIRTPLVIYRTSSVEAHGEARRFVVESALSIH